MRLKETSFPLLTVWILDAFNAGIPIAHCSSIYAHALEADELAAAKIWNDAMSEVIGEYKRQPERMLANVSAEGAKKLQVVEKKGYGMAGTTGLEPATSDVTGRRSNQLNYVPASSRTVPS